MTGYNYTWFLADVEQYFSSKLTQEWMSKNWSQTIHYSLIYLVIISSGQKFMTFRKPFELKGPLIAWNFFLASFSILGAIRYIPHFVHTLKTQGLVFSACFSDFHKGPGGFWTLLFTLSKVPELIDTVFLVLRKRPVIFLHWYHHITVLIYSWHSYKDFIGGGRWFVMMNLMVHSIMYMYYGLRAWGFRFPRWFPMSITTLQLSQMVVGCFINGIVVKMKLQGKECPVPNENLLLSSLMYASYAVLFSHFFYQSYFVKKKDEKRNKETENSQANENENATGTVTGHSMDETGDKMSRFDPGCANGHVKNPTFDTANPTGSENMCRNRILACQS